MKSEINQAIRTMANQIDGGHAAAAATLGYTLPAFENRLYQVKGQRLSIEEAMLLQRLCGAPHFADAVACQSGGVFVPLPEEASSGTDIAENFVSAVAKLGQFADTGRQATADGRISRREKAALWQRCHAAVSELMGIVVETDRVFGNGAQE